MTSSSGAVRDEQIGMIVKAFNLWIDGKTSGVSYAKHIKVRKRKDKDTGKLVLAETPKLGGLDTERQVESHEDDEE